MTAESLRRPLSIDVLHDGGIYSLAEAAFVQTNLFVEIARVDDLYIKIPSERGFADYRSFVRLGESSAVDIRVLEPEEQFEKLDELLQFHPEFRNLIGLGAEVVHYLMVHKLQYLRMQTQTALRIPRARFAVLDAAHSSVGSTRGPALFQERVRGTTLWNMFDSAERRIASPWQQHLPDISRRLSELLDSSLVNHIDWNIRNFIFQESTESLFYVDMKPTILLSKESNNQNLRGIRDYFIV